MDEFPRAVNCQVIPRGMLWFDGAIDASVSEGGVLDPPPELPQLVSSIMISNRRGTLFNFIDRNYLRDQCRYISAALQVTHVPPCLHDHADSFHLLCPLATFAGRLLPGFPIFA